MKKVLTAFFALAAMLCCVFALTACVFGGDDGEKHSMRFVETQEPTCEEDGYDGHYHCDECGKDFQDFEGTVELSPQDYILEATGHSWSDWIYPEGVLPPTCTRAGEQMRTCSDCGKTETRTVEALGHKGVAVAETTAGCTEKGVKAHYRCERCGETYSDEACTQPVSKEELEIPASGHTYAEEWSWDDNMHWKAAVCRHDVKGEQMYHDFEEYDSYEKCKVCGYTVDHTALLKAEYSKDRYIVMPDKGKMAEEDAWYLDLSKIDAPDGAKIEIRGFRGYFNLNGIDFGGKNVVCIDDNAFSDCEKLTKVSIPATVSSLGDHAFYNCAALKNVTFEKDKNGNTALISIGSEAFAYTAFSSIDIPGSVDKIGSGAFSCNRALTAFSFPEKVTSLELNMFNGCTALESVTLPETIDKIPQYAFKDCESLQEIEIPESVTAIERYAFNGCKGLQKIELPSPVTNIGECAFDGCSGLTKIVIPAAVQTVEAMAFSNCSVLVIYCEAESLPQGWASNWNGSNRPVVWNCKENNVAEDGNVYAEANGIRYALKDGSATLIKQSSALSGKIVIPDEIEIDSVTYPVTKMEEGAFRSCSHITEIELLPDGIENIPYNAFYGCLALEKVIISGGVKSIGRDAFYFTGIKEVHISDLAAWCAIEFGGETANPLSEIEAKLYLNGKEVINAEIPAGTARIGAYAFSGYGYLQSVTIPAGVKEIGQSAFANCTALTKAVLPDGLTSIENMAFYECTQLGGLTIPDSVTYMADDVFSGCTALVEEEGGVLYVGAWVVGSDRDITEATVREGTKRIAEYAFGERTDLSKVTLPEGLIGLCDRVFIGCASLTEISLPDSLQYIGDNVFDNCSALQYTWDERAKYLGNEDNPYLILMGTKETGYIFTFTLKEETRFIGAYALQECNLSTSLTLHENLLEIGDYAFYNSKVTSVAIPDSVHKIGEYAFQNCTSLKSVTIGSGVTKIETSTFDWCPQLKTLVLPKSIKSIEQNAFDGCQTLEAVYFEGTKEEWDKIAMDEGNDDLKNAPLYYYSETDPFKGEGAAAEGNFWHYDTDGVTPVIWSADAA